MGIDLSLLPYEGSATTTYSHSVLRLEDTGIVERVLNDVEPRGRVNSDFTSFLGLSPDRDGFHYGLSTTDAYAKAVTYCAARDLAPMRDLDCVRCSPRNRAVFAYLAELDPDHIVALFFH